MRVEELEVEIGAKALPGDLALPEGARGLVVFAHGSGSTRRSPRNRMVARVLQQAGFATLLFDLLTPLEALDRVNVFDIALLGRRLLEAIGWALKGRNSKPFPSAASAPPPVQPPPSSPPPKNQR